MNKNDINIIIDQQLPPLTKKKKEQPIMRK